MNIKYMRECKICKSNELKPRQQICDKCRLYNCENCNIEFIRSTKDIKGNRRFCSVKCAQSSSVTKKKIMEANVNNNGGVGFQVINKWEDKTEDEQRHQIQKMREGLKSYTSNKDNVKSMRKKAEKTNIERYGAKNTLSRESSIRSLADKNRNMSEIHRKAQITKSNWSDEKRNQVNKKISEANKSTWENTSEELKNERSKKISESRKRFFENETFEEKDERIRLLSEGQERWWNSLSDIEKEKVNERRMNNFNSPNSKFPIISGINRSWAKRFHEITGYDFDFEYHLNGMSYDLICENLIIDINPTVSHNSDISFSHIVGLCNVNNCKKHNGVDKNYHTNRALNALNDDKDWVFVYDYSNKKVIEEIVKYKLGLYENYINSKFIVGQITKDEAINIINNYYLYSNYNEFDYAIKVEDEKGEFVTLISVVSLDCNSIEINNVCFNFNYDINLSFECALNFIKDKYNIKYISYFDDLNVKSVINLKYLGFKSSNEVRSKVTKIDLKTGNVINSHEDIVLPEEVRVYEANEIKYTWEEEK